MLHSMLLLKAGQSAYLKELKKWEDKAKENGAGCWSKAPPVRNWIAEPEKTEASGKTSKQSHGPLASAQKVTASSAPTAKAAPETFGRERKHFSELRVLHRDVRIVFEGFDKSGLIGSVYYLDGIKKDLAVQLVENKKIDVQVNPRLQVLQSTSQQRDVCFNSTRKIDIKRGRLLRSGSL
ncbi:hypothetical protein POM88_013744 [Heracleum sosnowskyi]|uniref:TNase-like domain-containing protein n=1 Tax=Heracleum sosnowskyi TaxID=360622 RepID=A0AAD8J0G2_9APIA|nr:hypothetical protein POM88_013744 [Heracleum sosnowskyi]